MIPKIAKDIYEWTEETNHSKNESKKLEDGHIL